MALASEGLISEEVYVELAGEVDRQLVAVTDSVEQ